MRSVIIRHTESNSDLRASCLRVTLIAIKEWLVASGLLRCDAVPSGVWFLKC